MILEGRRGSDRGFNPVLALKGVARAHPRPVGQGPLRTLGHPRRRRRLAAVIHILVRVLVEVGSLGKVLARQGPAGALAGGALRRRLRTFAYGPGVTVVTLQKRIALQLLLAIFGQFEVR